MKLTIAKRLIPVVATAIVGVSLMASLSKYSTDRIYTATDYANVSIIPSLLILEQIRKNALMSRVVTYRYIFTPNSTDSDLLESRIVDYEHKIDESFIEFATNGCSGSSCIADAKISEFFQKEKKALSQYNLLIHQIMLKSRQGPAGVEEAYKLTANSAPIFQDLLALFELHVDYSKELSKKQATLAAESKDQTSGWLLTIALLTLIAIGSMGYMAVRSIVRQLGGEPEDAAKVAAQLALGDLSQKINLQPNDKDSLMAKLHQLVLSMERVADRADAVGRGNLSDEVVVLSEQDRLGKAINHMVVALRSARIVDDKRNWLSSGTNRLSQALTGDFSPQQIAKITLSEIGHYLQIGRGVLYTLRSDEPVLDLIGSYMFSESSQPQSSFKLGEGAIGQVAIEKAPIYLTVAAPDANQPSSVAPIITGTSNSAPNYIYTYPVLKENDLLGVLEISSFTPLDELKLDYLMAAIEMLSSFIYVAEQRGQIRSLLQVAEQAEREVRKHNDYLQDVNSRMEEQQQQLQQQSEELQQSNAQMEEQQQQLQQQAEELQQTNAQLKEQQQLLERNNTYLRESQNDIDEKAKQLELSNHYKSEFLANMSHELRTPLNAIILLSKMMLENPDGNLSASEIKRAEVIHRSGNDLLRLISDVLDLSKVDAGRMEMNFTEVSSSAISAELHDLFESVAEQSQLEFIVQDKLQNRFISDSGKISQIMRNLLSNAFKFTKQGSVTLTIERDDQEALPIRIKVRDTGIGIPKNKTKMVFDAFRQVDGSTSREYGGTGLGLTISLRFAQLLGGTISLNSTEGKGSEFCLHLPDRPVEAMTESAVNAVTSSTPSAPVEIRPPTEPIFDDRSILNSSDKVILLIDDDVNFAAAVIEINHRLGYKTIVAQNGQEGLGLAKQYRPSGILLDLGLPDRDGTDILRDIKSDQELAAIPVYIISGRDHDSALSKKDIVGYLQKPVISSQIAEAEAALLNAIAQVSFNGVLIVTSEDKESQDLVDLITTHQRLGKVEVRQVTPDSSLSDALHAHDWGVVIIDLAELSIAQGLDAAQIIQTHSPTTAVLFFGVPHLSDEDEAKLLSYSDSIIINAPQAGLRLQENIERFLRTVPKIIQPAVASSKVNPAEKKLKDRSVLVIDDDPRNLFVITAALEQQGARVWNALNGRRALDMLEKITVDLIITDIMMPEMDGYQTIAAIRANPNIAHVSVVALTAKAMPQDRKNILEIGADDYLSKPVDYDVLTNMAAFWCATRHG